MTHPVKEHEQKEHHEEMVCVVEDLELGASNFIWSRRIDHQHGERHHCSRHKSSSLIKHTAQQININTN